MNLDKYRLIGPMKLSDLYKIFGLEGELELDKWHKNEEKRRSNKNLKQIRKQ